MKNLIIKLISIDFKFFFVYPIADINNVSQRFIWKIKLPEELHTVEFLYLN